MITIQINSESKTLKQNTTLNELIELLKIGQKIMACAVNMEIVKQSSWTTYELKDGDKVEFLEFVGGG